MGWGRSSYRNSEIAKTFISVCLLAYQNSEIDAYGVRGFGSVMPTSKLAVATLASHAFELTTTSLVLDPSLFRKKSLALIPSE